MGSDPQSYLSLLDKYEQDRVKHCINNITSPPAPGFLNWVADRLVNVYHENENTDFVQALRRLANTLTIYE